MQELNTDFERICVSPKLSLTLHQGKAHDVTAFSTSKAFLS